MANPSIMSTFSSTWVNWFEIPVADFERARRCYETIFDTELMVNDLGTVIIGLFARQAIGGSICKDEFYQPGTQGPLLYLNANPDLQVVQDRIAAAGGKVLIAKRQISPQHGYMAVFRDTEGNRLALHSEA